MEAVWTHVGGASPLVVAMVVAVVMAIDVSPILGLLVPADLIVVGVFSSSGIGGAALAYVGIVVGTLVGWTVFFWLGRSMGPALHRGRIGRWVRADRWETAEHLLTGRGARALVLVQFLPVFNAVVPMAAGILAMPYRQFIKYASIGTALWALAFGALGFVAGAASDALLGGSPFGVVLFAAPGLAAGWAVLAYLRREVVARRERVASAS